MKVAARQSMVSLYMVEARRRIGKGWVQFSLQYLPLPVRQPERLLVAPTDLHAADTHIADEMLSGRFALAGRVLETGGGSPFDFDLPSIAFANRLHSFVWLRDVRAAQSEQHCRISRRIVDDWMLLYGRSFASIAWEPEIASQRLISWLSHSPVILKEAELKFYRRFLKSIALHVRFLKLLTPYLPENDTRLRCRIALALASLSLPASAKDIRRASAALDKELERQILPDGGHVSRNPRIILELLLLLLPLRQTYINLGYELPAKLIPAIDRMFPALRFFRHQGGELALFNGATSALANELASVLRYDETSGGAYKSLPYVQFHRLAVKETVVIADTGKALTTEMSRTANAGALSFEMSSGRNRFIVNSGAPKYAGKKYQALSRMTAAHSAVTVNDNSCFKLSLSEFLGPVVIAGVDAVSVERREEDGGAQGLNMRHDGYVDVADIVVERDLQLSSSGAQLRGRERLLGTNGGEPSAENKSTAVARFHIHPSIAIRVIDENEVYLRAADGEVWSFSCIDTPVEVTEDVYFADPSGMRISQQIELAFDARENPEIQWVMTRKQSGAASPD